MNDRPYFFIRFSDEYKERCQESIVLSNPIIIRDVFIGDSTYYKTISTANPADILLFDLPEYIGFAVNEGLVPTIKETFELPFIYSPEQFIDSIALEQHEYEQA